MTFPTSPTMTALLVAASDIVDATARATVKAADNPRKELAHIDAAKSFTLAADFLYEAAEWIAEGGPVRGEGTELFRLWLRGAETKMEKGIRQIAKS